MMGWKQAAVLSLFVGMGMPTFAADAPAKAASGVAVYLASSASAYTTGEQFVIDGGYTKF